MTNKEAISNLEELYPVVSEEKKQAIDTAIKALAYAEWIEVEPTEDDKSEGFDIRIVCSKCKEPNRYFEFNENHETIAVSYCRTRYCPNCGARMLKDFDGGEIK